VAVARALVRHPSESRERILERLDERKEEQRPPASYRVHPDWEQHLHGLLGAPWPCTEREGFSRVWRANDRLLTELGLRTGRGAFGGWDDGDEALARAAWCITRHRRPHVVLETGVGRGLSTRVILEALEENGGGHLWSIDLPPIVQTEIHSETAALVPFDRRSRWTLVHGSSRKRLRGLLERTGPIDFFLHDSMHTRRNMLFELHTVWPALARGGFVLMDDIERNGAFASFADSCPDVGRCLIAQADDGRALVGILLKALDDGPAPGGGARPR
jgi:hypothetical protein